ncbi:MAG TPA: ABC transporter permease subunit [Verrucomicrobiae bacterium]|nr:ABC transporter permease subunit [Verrucomicrobiae bacterium]
MTFLPIVSRELRLASRRRATYWLRSGAALATMLLGTWLFLLFQGQSPKELAVALFCVLTGGGVLFALLSGPRSTADCISEEKREGTLGLLFLTDLKGYDVVLGKLVAGSLNSFYTVVAILPTIAIPLLLGGGITLSEIGRMSLVTINALFFSLTMGVWASAMSRSAQKAAALSLLLILLTTAVLPACGALIAAAHSAPRVSAPFLVSSVGFTYYLSFDAPYKSAKLWFWWSLGIVHGLSWLGLILASVITPVSWQDRPLGDNSLMWRQRWKAWSFGNQLQRLAFRRRLLDINPVLWLAARGRTKAVGLWLFLGVIGCVWAWGWWKFRREWLNEGIYLSTAALLNLALRYWLAGEATRALADQRKTGALELLLSTPMRVEEILHGQWLALRRQFFGPVVTVLIVETLFMLGCAREAVPDEDRSFWISLWIAIMVMLVADLVALYAIGLWQGLTARNPLRALGGTLARVLVLPWIAYGAVLLLVVLAQFGSTGNHPSPGWQFFLGLWFGLGIGADLLFGISSWQRLLTEFRRAAQEQYGVRSDFWRRWFFSLKPHVSGVAAENWEIGH